MKTITLIRKLREALDITKCIQILIYGKLAYGMDVTEGVKVIENESPLTRLKIFNQMKKII